VQGGANVAREVLNVQFDLSESRRMIEEATNNPDSDDVDTFENKKNPCEVHTGPSIKDDENRAEECTNEVKRVFTKYFEEENFAQSLNAKWEGSDLNLYAVGGGITWAMRYDVQDNSHHGTQRNSWDHTMQKLEKIQRNRCRTYIQDGEKGPEKGIQKENFNQLLNLQKGEFNKHYKDACFKVTYFLFVLKHLGVTDKETVIHIRKKFVDKTSDLIIKTDEKGNVISTKHKEIAPEWVRASVMKSAKPETFPYDVESLSLEATNSYAARMETYENNLTSSPAPSSPAEDIPEEVEAGTEENVGGRLI
jgi:hypothetical protein